MTRLGKIGHAPAGGTGMISTASTTPTTTKMVFAHYFVPYPISIDNKTASADWYVKYLTPGGDPPSSAPYGGLLRDRPIPRQVRSSTSWRVEDMSVEINQARSVGIDGFAMDIMYDPTSTGWQATEQKSLFMAASAVSGFKIMLMPDMTSGLFSGISYQKAASICYYYASAFPNTVYKVSGSVVITPFAAERQTPSWWSSFIAHCSASYGMNVAFMPLFNGVSTSSSSSTYKSISYGMTEWGNRNPAGNPTASSSTPITRIRTMHNNGLVWMQPVSVQDERPNQSIYDESQNLQNLRNTWKIAIDGHADLVQIPTWNDYSENAHIAPSRDHGWTYTNIQKYYIQWFKTGVQPTISSDAIYLTHRKHFYSDTPTYPQTSLMKLRGGSSPSRDTVEAMAFLPTSASVRISSGTSASTFAASAGINIFTIPLQAGISSASIIRSGSVTVSTTTASAVTHSPYVQDLQYISSHMDLPTGWTKVLFFDDFDGSSVNSSKWNVRDSTTQSNTHSRNFAKCVTVSNSILKIRSGTDNTVDPGSYPWVSGYLDTIGKFSVQNGRWEARLRFPWGTTAYGYWPAFWLRPDDSGNGEIDIMEAWPLKNDVHQTIWKDYTGTPHVEGTHVAKAGNGFDPTQWHVYAVEKEAGSLKFYVDGVLWWDATNSASWRSATLDRTVNWNIRLNLQIGDSGYGGDPTASTVLSQTYDIDWVRVLAR